MHQNTIKKEASISGIGLHSGKIVNLKLRPADADFGVVFVRTDLPSRPRLKAGLERVTSTVRGTNLGDVGTVEHLLSALYALSISNIIVEIDGPEPPALDGSAKPYCALILKAGIAPQRSKLGTLIVKKPIVISEEGKSIIAVPADRFTVSFMINYPNGFIGSQFYSTVVGPKAYVRDIAPARTYGFMEELDALKKQGLALGAGPDNAVAMDANGYLTKLRFKDELVRHKILDLIGDVSLLGKEIRAHIIGVRSGHDMNIRLARKLKEVG